MNRNPCRSRVAYLSDHWTAVDPSESFTLHGSWCTSGARGDTESCALFAQLPRGVRKRIEGYGCAWPFAPPSWVSQAHDTQVLAFSTYASDEGPVGPPP